MKKIKMEIGKKIDWHKLVGDLLDCLFYSQQDLSDLCQVSQQSISNWKSRTRNPGIFAKQMLFKVAQKEKVDLSKYEMHGSKEAMAKFIEKNSGKELAQLFEIYNKMSKADRLKFIKYGNTLVK